MKTKHINLKWAKNDEKGKYNFGDDLNPYLISNLSGVKVKYITYANSRWNITKQFFRSILNLNITVSLFRNYITSIIVKEYIIAIGSIIQWYSSKRCIVWGSGIISRKDYIKKSKFLAVRGNYTLQRIKELGYQPPKILGDPAILLPIIYKKKLEKIFRLGIIPHVNHYHLLKEINLPDDILLINLNNDKIESVIDQILLCEHTISSSLHGLIVSHAYSIKSLWFIIPSNPLAGDDIKFFDYFTSVNIQEYPPFQFVFNENINSNEIIDIINANNKINQIQSNIQLIQQKLLDVAPFPVKQVFRYGNL